MAYTDKRILLALLLLSVVFTAVAPTIQPAKAQMIQFWVDAYDFTEGYTVSVEFYINGQSQGVTPQLIIGDMSAYISADHTDSFGNVLRGFAVNGYLYLGEVQPLTISNYEGATITAYYEAEPTPPEPTPTPTPEPTVPPTNDPTPTPPPIMYALAVQIVGQGTVTPLGTTNYYAAGTIVQQEATPAAGWEFVRGELYDIDLNLIGVTESASNAISMTENWITVYYFKEISATVAPTITPTIPPTQTPPPTAPPTVPPSGNPTPTTNPNNPTPTPTPFEPPTYASYYLVGVNNETSGLKITAPVPVVSFYNNGHIPEVFWVDGVYHYQTNAVPQHFVYILGDTVHREYWLRPDEASGTMYITNATLTEYTINFLDQTGVLKKNYYVAFQNYLNGTLTTVEKRKIDAQNSVVMFLEKGQRYNVVIEGFRESDFQYGEITMTAITGVQLIIRGVDFPKDTLLLYQYVHANAIRTNLTPFGDITISYGDSTGQTISVTIQIQNATSSQTVFTQTFANQQTFSASYHQADNQTSYQVIITVTHRNYGTFTFRQLLSAQGQEGNNAFSLDFLGVISSNFNTAYFLPALLIILIAGCFSEITAEAAAVISSILAVILAYMGWLPVPSAALIVALCFSLMAGIVAARKRMQYA